MPDFRTKRTVQELLGEGQFVDNTGKIGFVPYMDYFGKDGSKLPPDPRDWDSEDYEYVMGYLLQLSDKELEIRCERQRRQAIASFRRTISHMGQEALVGRTQMYWDAYQRKLEIES